MLLNGNALIVTDAGRGETPPCLDAKFKPGDVVKRRKMRAVAHMPEEFVVAVACPPGFPIEYALADLVGEARPLMITRPRPKLQYVLVRENDPTPYCLPERYLLPSGKPSIEIGTCRRETAAEASARGGTAQSRRTT